MHLPLYLEPRRCGRSFIPRLQGEGHHHHVIRHVVLNDLDRFHLVGDVIDPVPGLAARAAYAKQALQDKLIEHQHYIREYGEDLSEVRNWNWNRKG
ncbi:MAG: hypothetical protein WA496_11815 [Candidatus Udaeobacter sp.]